MPQTDRALICIVHSGTYERVRFTLAVAAAAAAANRPVTLFFTMDACVTLQGKQGWHALHAGEATSAADADAVLRGKGVAGFEELLTACADLGVKMLVCDMGLRATGLAREQLTPGFPIEVGGLFSLLSGDGAESQLLYC